jgi:hypothetical protein
VPAADADVLVAARIAARATTRAVRRTRHAHNILGGA